MVKLFLKPIWVVIIVCSLQVSIWADEIRRPTAQQMHEIEMFFSRGAEKEGFEALRRINDEFPDDISAAASLWLGYRQRGRYAEGIPYLEEVLRRSEHLGKDAQTLGTLHRQIFVDYEELGRQNYFSPELCLRMLYHIDCLWHFLSDLKDEDPEKLAVYTKKILEWYNVATTGTQLTVIDPKEITFPMKNQELKPTLKLHNDNIPDSEKLKARGRLISRIQTYGRMSR